MPVRSSRWRVLWLGVSAFVLAAGIHGLFHWLAPPDARPRPGLAAIPWVVTSVGVAALMGSAVAAGRRARGLARTLGAVLLHGLLAMAGLMGAVLSDPAFPFGPNYVESLSLPGEHGTAYLYRGGMFCWQSVRRAEPGALWSFPDPAVEAIECTVRGQLRWSEGRVRIVDAHGAELRPPPPRWGGGWSPR